MTELSSPPVRKQVVVFKVHCPSCKRDHHVVRDREYMKAWLSELIAEERELHAQIEELGGFPWRKR